MPSPSTSVSQGLGDWHYLSAQTWRLLSPSPLSLSQAQRQLEQNFDCGRIRLAGSWNLRGRWYARECPTPPPSGISTDTGVLLPQHLLAVVSAASVVRERYPAAQLLSETALRRDHGWFYKRLSWSHRNPFFTYVPDFLLNCSDGVWRVEVQLSRVPHSHWGKVASASADSHPILVLTELPNELARAPIVWSETQQRVRVMSLTDFRQGAALTSASSSIPP